MAEWLYEQGIGENRAALIADGEIVEAEIELPGQHRAGAVLVARLTTILIPARRGIAALEEGGEALVEPLPPALTEGARINVEIVREALAETGRLKRARARVTTQPPRQAPALIERLARAAHPLRQLTGTAGDPLEAAGWSEMLEEAGTGHMRFEGGALVMSLTPAMTLFDVDGALPPAALAIAGAAAAGRAIRRHGIGGSIGIDLPTLASRDQRQAAGAALDRALPQPFERTAVNGFGFLQVVRRRTRASQPEIGQGDPVGAAARALARRAGRVGPGALLIRAAPAVIACIAQARWQDELARLCGGGVALQPDPSLSISTGHVQPHPR